MKWTASTPDLKSADDLGYGLSQRREKEYSGMNTDIVRTVVGFGRAKNVFALRWIDHKTGKIVSRTLGRGSFCRLSRIWCPVLLGWRRAASLTIGRRG